MTTAIETEWNPLTSPDQRAEVTIHRGRLGAPLDWKTSRIIRVAPTIDLFHPWIARDNLRYTMRAAVWGVMAATPRHTYHLTTRFPANLASFSQRVYREAFAAYCEASLDRETCLLQSFSDDWLAMSCQYTAEVEYGALSLDGSEEDIPWPFPNVEVSIARPYQPDTQLMP